MTPSSPNTQTRRHAPCGESGSTVLAALGILTVTLILVSTALTQAQNRFRTSHQSSRWSQAEHAAEAGAELALLSAQKTSWTADGWASAPGAPGAAAITKTFTLSTGVPATGPVNASVAVDQVALDGANWLRIRSTGKADVAGGTAAGADPQDVLLRKLSLRKDRSDGTSVGAAPRATRTVEILAAPKASRPFKNAFVVRENFSINTDSKVDSYDSSDASKSDFSPFGSYGVYAAAKRQQHGDVATLSTASWSLNSASIRGDVHTPTGVVSGAGNVSGSITSGFEFTFPDEVSPGWTTVTQNHGVVSNVSKTIVAGTQASPTRHKFTSISLTSDDKSIRIQNPAGATESWIEVWVTGATTIAGQNNTGIRIDPGVHCTIYFGDSVSVVGNGGAGYGIRNDSKLPSSLIIRAYGGDSGTMKDFSLKEMDFWGVVSAPWYRVKYDLDNQNASGAVLSRQFTVTNRGNLHYDESLASLALGQSAGYSVRSWVEGVR